MIEYWKFLENVRFIVLQMLYAKKLKKTINFNYRCISPRYVYTTIISFDASNNVGPTNPTHTNPSQLPEIHLLDYFEKGTQ